MDSVQQIYAANQTTLSQTFRASATKMDALFVHDAFQIFAKGDKDGGDYIEGT